LPKPQQEGQRSKVWFYIDWYWGIRTKGRFLFFAQLQVFEDKEKEFSAPPEIATVRLGKICGRKD
jgi:hypothetical protein